MHTNPDVSIIVPVYNVAKYLPCCLNSLAAMPAEVDYECILIDDGSVDGSDKILMDFVRTHPRFISIRQANRGAGAARNIGLDKARGRYIMFVDADDLLDTAKVPMLIREMDEHDLDILIFGYQCVDPKTKKVSGMLPVDKDVYCKKNFNDIINVQHYPEILRDGHYLWHKVFKRQFLENNNIRFPEVYFIEDMPFLVHSLCAAQRIKIIPLICYRYTFCRRGSLTEHIYDYRCLSTLSLYRDCEEILKRFDVSEYAFMQFYIFKFNHISGFSKNSLNFGYDIYYMLEMEIYNTLLSLSSSTIRSLIINSDNIDQHVIDVLYANKLHLKACPLPENELLLSIIVAVYNVAPYLRKSLDSILAQTIPSSCYEVILVDDASTDGSLDICREYTAKYENFRLLELSEHTPGSFGAPCNAGMAIAQGRYIGFVDSDDYAYDVMFEELLNSALIHDSDLVVCKNVGYDLLDNDMWYIEYSSQHKNNSKYKRFEAKSKLLLSNPPPWLKIYKREFIVHKKIQIPVSNDFFEDHPFHWLCILETNKISIVNKFLIIHTHNRQGQTIYSYEGTIGIARQLMNIYIILIDHGVYQRYKFIFIRRISMDLSSLIPFYTVFQRKMFYNIINLVTCDYHIKDIYRYHKLNRIPFARAVYDYLLIKSWYRLSLFAYPVIVQCVKCYISTRRFIAYALSRRSEHA